jgi:hypothetical protein
LFPLDEAAQLGSRLLIAGAAGFGSVNPAKTDPRAYTISANLDVIAIYYVRFAR